MRTIPFYSDTDETSFKQLRTIYVALYQLKNKKLFLGIVGSLFALASCIHVTRAENSKEIRQTG